MVRLVRLTDEQWERIRAHLPDERGQELRPGRKPIPARKVLDAALWILCTGTHWHALPPSYPSYKTVHRRFRQWCQNEAMRNALTALADQLRAGAQIERSAGTLLPAAFRAADARC